MAKELIINATLPEVRIALLEEGNIQELLIERQSDKGIVGNIYKGRVTRVLPGMQAAFVDVGLDKAAFLYVDDIYVHPKVMGEETEVHGEGQYDDDESQDGPITQNFGHREEFEEVQSSQGGSDQDAQNETHEPQQNDQSDENSESQFGQHADEHRGDQGDAEADSQSDDQNDNYDTSSLESHVSEHAEQDLTTDEVAEEFQAAAQEQMQEALESDGDFESDEEGDSEEDSEEDFAETPESMQAESGESTGPQQEQEEGSLQGLRDQNARKGRRSRNRNRNRKRGGREGGNRNQFAGGESFEHPENVPEAMTENLNDSGMMESDRAALSGEVGVAAVAQNRGRKPRPEFREQRGRDRRIKSKSMRPRAQANIADLLKEGQEVIVQVAKDPIATKGARLTCHVSLPGRHLVCMPSIDHVGVSRRIERDDERRRLRDFVEKNRPKKMGFIVRTASGGKDPESWIKQDIDYLSKLWGEIRTRADEVSAPALVYEDLNSTLRAIRDWVNEDIEKIIVDTRYHFNELNAFADRFMPALLDKIELYQGDIPVFDAYGLSAELHRSLERRVWLKSGGYIVIDQAEALVAIDVNTGRFVGKKNLEDTILKTNLEAAEEIAYQLRLRNCGGMIIVDFIDMERDDNKMRVYRALDEALKKDRARPTIQKISELGLVEMTRKRTRDTLVRTLCEPCSHCEGKGYTKSYNTVAYEILREIERLSIDKEAKKILVSAHDAVINILAIELRDALDQLERKYNKSVFLQSVLDYHAEQFEVVTDRMQGKKQNVDIARQLRMERDRTERKDKGRERNQNRNQHQHQQNRREEAESDVQIDEPRNEPKMDRPKPSGSFITARAASKPETMEESAQDQDAPRVQVQDDIPDEDRQPNFDALPKRSRASIPAVPMPEQNFSDMDDEDQLAYLRAQAAQDAAIASLATPGGMPFGHQGGGGRNQQNQNRNNRNQNNRNRNNRGGRNPNQRQGGGHGGHGGGNRFRPNHNRGGDNVGNREIVAAPAVDYDAPARGGDGSDT